MMSGIMASAVRRSLQKAQQAKLNIPDIEELARMLYLAKCLDDLKKEINEMKNILMIHDLK